MNFSELVVMYAGLALVVVLFIPVPHGPTALAGGVEPRSDDAPRCVSVQFAPERPGFDYRTTTFRLRSKSFELHHGWYEGESREQGLGDDFAWWQPAGRDSIDIRWHHSPLIRIPIPSSDPSAHAVGRRTKTWPASLLMRMYLYDTPVKVSAMSCDQFGDGSSVP